MRLARYERAGEARLAMVAGEDILDILDALDDLSDAPANAYKWFSDMTALIEAGPVAEEILQKITSHTRNDIPVLQKQPERRMGVRDRHPNLYIKTVRYLLKVNS